MSALPKSMSLDEFVAWEERQELRHEYDGVTVRAMTGGTVEHARIQMNLAMALGPHLRSGPCFLVGSELKLRTKTTIRYPDAMVICSKTAAGVTSISEPVVIFEILSPSSARRDLGEKNAEYQALESLRRYIVLHQDVVAAEVFFRDDEGEWSHKFAAADEMLEMPEIGAEIALSACYEGIEFSGASSRMGPKSS